MRALLLLLVAAAAHASPCTTASQECTEWLKLPSGDSRSLIYRSHPLEIRNNNIRRALIVIHGQERNADQYFRTALAAAFLAGGLDDTIVISPRFASHDGHACQDTLAAAEVNWRCAGDSWRSGAQALSDNHLTSYDFTDEILRKLARPEVFPNLRHIVVSGHSAGGQYVSRYVMANRVHDSLGIPITYVVSNPSSYAYLDSTRPAPSGDLRHCKNYDHWPYGLEDRTGYASQLTGEQLKTQMAARPVTYLLSELDTLPIAGFDSSCPAMVQGPSRFARGQAYAGYVNKNFGAKHAVVKVPLCGHNARCVFTAEPSLPVLFPN